MRDLLLRFGLLSVWLMVLPACGGGQQTSTVPRPGPPIPGVNLNGKWYSDEFGDMQVVHDRQNIRGTYEDPRGPDHNGTFKGILQGDLIKLDWIKKGNPLAAIPSARGRAWLKVTHKGTKMQGRWGYDDSREDGGKWTAEKSQYQ